MLAFPRTVSALTQVQAFDKFAGRDVVIQRATRSMVSMGYLLLCAVSRKRFVGAVSGVAELPSAMQLRMQFCIAITTKARILRVHDVAGTAQAINAYRAGDRARPRQGRWRWPNVGDPAWAIQRNAAHRRNSATCVVSSATLYETGACIRYCYACGKCVAEIRTELHPLVLMDKLLEVENAPQPHAQERRGGPRPRTIDCDLLWVGGRTTRR